MTVAIGEKVYFVPVTCEILSPRDRKRKNRKKNSSRTPGSNLHCSSVVVVVQLYSFAGSVAWLTIQRLFEYLVASADFAAVVSSSLPFRGSC